jgi:hypothetical protein
MDRQSWASGQHGGLGSRLLAGIFGLSWSAEDRVAAFAVRTRSSRSWLLGLAACAAVALTGCAGGQSNAGPTATPHATSSATQSVSAATMACYNLTIMSTGLQNALSAAETHRHSTAIAPAAKWNQVLLHDGSKLASWAAQLSHASTPNSQLVTGIRRAGAAVTEVAKGRTSAAARAIRDIDAVKSLCD